VKYIARAGRVHGIDGKRGAGNDFIVCKGNASTRAEGNSRDTKPCLLTSCLNDSGSSFHPSSRAFPVISGNAVEPAGNAETRQRSQSRCDRPPSLLFPYKRFFFCISPRKAIDNRQHVPRTLPDSHYGHDNLRRFLKFPYQTSYLNFLRHLRHLWIDSS
jgi:hypothetical protein